MKKENTFFKVLLTLFSLSPYLHSNIGYGPKSLKSLLGIELFVHCAGDVEIVNMEEKIRNRLKSKLEAMSIPYIAYYNNKNNSGALKFLLAGVKREEGDYFVYATMQLHQRAYLAATHEYMDCQTWDMWKMGIFSTEDILFEAEQMIREFANDFISANSF